jgi:plastocyanin
VLIAVMCALVLFLGACSSSSLKTHQTASPPLSIAIKTFTFSPTPLSTKAGESVTWTNNDQILHTATSGVPGAPSSIFEGQMDGPGKTFRFTFMVPGRYPYFCSRHNGMLGEIVVGS